MKDLPNGAPLQVRWDKRRFGCEEPDVRVTSSPRPTDQLGRRRDPRRWRQYRKQPPLAHLRSDAALRAQAPPTWGRRWPGPDRHQKELATPERCRAYARLAEEVARSRTVAAEMALFLASGLLGATLPHYFDRNHWWELGAVGAVTGLGAGLRLRFLARDWQRRAAYHHQRAGSHDQRP